MLLRTKVLLFNLYTFKLILIVDRNKIPDEQFLVKAGHIYFDLKQLRETRTAMFLLM